MLDYYAILEVPPTADAQTVKSAYRRLALRYHPDVNPAPEAIERIKLVNEAYGVLGDPSQRQLYNLRREAYIHYLRQQEINLRSSVATGPTVAGVPTAPPGAARNRGPRAPHMPFGAPPGYTYRRAPNQRPGPGRGATNTPANDEFSVEGVGRAVGGGCLTIVILTIAVWVGIGLSEIFLWVTGIEDIGHIRLLFALVTLVGTIVVLLKYIARRYERRGVE